MISIIIPTANEAQCLPRTFAALEAAGKDVAYEILVVDAGSNDATVELARARGARVLTSAIRQRAAQMNQGAMTARGDAFLFLHGDTVLPTVALQKIEDALRHPKIVGGAFARRYDSSSRLLRMTCALAYLRGLVSGWFLGDQGIFVRAEAFRQLGGFQNFDLFEDLDFSRRLRQLGRTIILRPTVISAARRFERSGPGRKTWEDFLLTCRYLRGVSPRELASGPLPPPRSESAYEGT